MDVIITTSPSSELDLESVWLVVGFGVDILPGAEVVSD